MASLEFVHLLLVIMIKYFEIISASTIAPSPVISSVASLDDTLKQEMQATPTSSWSMSQMISSVSLIMQNGTISTSMISVNEIRSTTEVMSVRSHTQTLTLTNFGNLAQTRDLHPSATMQSKTSNISKFGSIATTASPSVMQTSVTKQSSAVVASRSVNGNAERTSQVSTNHITTTTPTGPQPTTSAGAMTHSSETVSTSTTSRLNSLVTSTQKLGQETITAVNTKSSLPTTSLDKFSFKITISLSSSFSANLMSSVQAPVTTSSPFMRNQYLIFGISGYLQNRTFSQDLADRTSHNYTILAMELSNTLNGILNQSQHFQKVEILNFTNDNSQVKVNAEAWFQNSSKISTGSLKAMIENGTMTFSQIEVKEKCSPVSCNGNGLCQATNSDVNCSCLLGFQGFRCLKTYPVDGNFSHWSNYQSCSKSCGDGVQIRTRTCTNPAPMHGGRNCSSIGAATETKACHLKSCNEQWILWIIIAAAAFVFLMVVILACCFGCKKKYYYQDYGLTKDGTSYNLKTNQAYINRAYEAQLSEFRSHESVVPLEIIKEDPFKNGYSNPEFVGGDSIDQSSRTVYQRELKTFLSNTKNIRAKKNDDHGEYIEPEQSLQPKKTLPSGVKNPESGGIVYGNDPGRLL